MADGLLQIQPEKELKFRFELKKQIPTVIRLTNPGNEEIAFKVKTTAPKKYCVKPNTGFVAAGATQSVQVIMQVQREWPSDLNACKDKFLVQSVMSGGLTDFTELFAKGKDDIKEAKLRVSYVQPAPPPSPVPEDEEEKGDGDVVGDMPESAERPAMSRMYTAKPAFEAPPAAEKPASAAAAAKDDGATEAAQERARLQRRVDELTSKNDSLQADLKMSLVNKPDSSSAAARGFSLLHLLITALFAFAIGIYYYKLAGPSQSPTCPACPPPPDCPRCPAPAPPAGVGGEL